MKFIHLMCIALAALAISTSAAKAAEEASPATAAFIKNATIGGSFEIASSQLALEKSNNAKIKDFAQKMIDDHTKADQKLKATLDTSGLSRELAPATLDTKHQKMYDDLKAAKTGFDKKFIAAQAAAHVEAVSLFTTYSKKGDNAALKSFATETLPTLQEHAKDVKALKS